MQNIFIARQCDLLAPPQWLLDRALQALAQGQPTQAQINKWPSAHTERTLVKDGKEIVNAFNHSIFLDSESIAWAREFICQEVIDFRVVFTRPGLGSSGPHTDGTRTRTLIYLLQTGGPDHATIFYQEKGSATLVHPPAYRVDDYSKLEVVHVVKLDQFKWTLLNATILHSVENISAGRLSLQISLPENILDNDPVLKQL